MTTYWVPARDPAAEWEEAWQRVQSALGDELDEDAVRSALAEMSETGWPAAVAADLLVRLHNAFGPPDIDEAVAAFERRHLRGNGTGNLEGIRTGPRNRAERRGQRPKPWTDPIRPRRPSRELA